MSSSESVEYGEQVPKAVEVVSVLSNPIRFKEGVAATDLVLAHGDSARVERSQQSVAVSSVKGEARRTIHRQIAIDDGLWLYVALGLIALGTLLIFFAIVFIMVTGNLALATVSGVSGILINAVSALVFRARNEARQRADILLDRLEREDRLEAIKCLISITKGRQREQVIEAYIQQLGSSWSAPLPPLRVPRAQRGRGKK